MSERPIPLEHPLTKERVDAWFAARGTTPTRVDIPATNPRPEHTSNADFHIPEGHRRVKL